MISFILKRKYKNLGFYIKKFISSDVDECIDPKINKCQQKCTNTAGGFYCECNEGYKKDAADDTKCVGEYVFQIDVIPIL